MKLSASQFLPSQTWTLTLTSCLLAALLCSSGLARAAAPASDFTIRAPAFGSFQSGQVAVTLQYITENETPTVQVQLNGRAINNGRLTTSCQGTTCTITGKLTLWDGLRVGENQLSATLTGRLHNLAIPTTSTPVLVERTRFDYSSSQGLQGGQYNNVNYYTPISLGLSTLPNGGGPSGNPWLQLTTGYPADWSAVADAWAFPAPPGSNNTVTIPYPDVSLGFICTGAPLQAYVLGRQNPYQKGLNDDKYVETGACFNTIAELQSQFQTKFNRSLGSQDLVIMGTAPGQTFPAGFDASPLGGTNFSQTPASEYPQSYIMIGVPGAPAGSAYESFSIAATTTHPNSSYLPALQGTLMQDQNNNYNFVPSGDTPFEVHSDATAGSSYIKVGSKTYTPPSSSGNNFWLLVLDQETLAPVNNLSTNDQSSSCDSTSATQSCGVTWTISPDGGYGLGTLLYSLSPHDLIFLVTQGCPVANNSVMQTWLGDVLHVIGGVPYSLNFTGATPHPQNSCNYSLVSVNDNNHMHPLNDPMALSVGGAFGSNNQYGSVHGFLARNRQGLYEVAGKAQMIPNSEGTGLASAVDYTFEYVTSSSRGDWPLVDTAYPIEAYADISYQILTALGYAGSRLYDVRYYYPSSAFLTDTSLGGIITDNLLLTTPTAKPFPESSWDNATPAQFTAALQQIGTELQQATSAYGYLGSAGVRGAMAGSISTIYADMIGKASVISTDYAGASNANANARLSKDLNLAGSIVGLGSVIPVVGPIFGVVGGALRVGSASISMGSTPPSPEAVFDTSLNDLANNSSTYVLNLTTGFDGALNNILSDSGKLSSIAALTSDTDSAWHFPSQLSADQLHDPLVNGASRSIWLDIIPQLYGIRQYFNGPSSNPGDYGVYEVEYDTCYNLYYRADQASYGSYYSIGSNAKNYDLYVFAENPTASTNDEVVTPTLANLLTTTGSSTIGGNTQNNLNLPPMLLYAYSNMNYSPFQGANGQPSKYVNYCTTHPEQ